MLSVALTGGIACGKSLLGQMLSRLGADVADADVIVRSLHAPGGKGAGLVADNFGGEFLQPDGSTDRAKLASLVFADAEARRLLDGLLHPIVRAELLEWKNRGGGAGIKVAQIPLLFEKGWEKDWDSTVCIAMKKEKRIEFIMQRGLAKEEAHARIAAQMEDAEKARRADIVVYNNATVKELEHTASRLYRHLEKINNDRRPT